MSAATGTFYRPSDAATNATVADAAGFASGESKQEDPTAWMLQGHVAWFILMHAAHIKYLCMFAYTYYHGCKLFGSLEEGHSIPYKFVRMIFQCTGGGLLVPIFINAIPVSLGNDAYPVAIFTSTLLHIYFPKIRDFVKSFPLAKALFIVLFETQRASVVVKLTTAAATNIPATEFDFPLFGPIFCGAVAGCGGAFLPMTKGLVPLEKGLAPNMLSAFIAATGYHLFTSTSLSDDIPNAAKKAQVVVAWYFIAYSLVKELDLSNMFKSGSQVVEKKESKDSKSKKE